MPTEIAVHPAVAEYPAWNFEIIDAAVERAEAVTSSSEAESPLWVLLTTGSMNPVHRGHLSILEQTAATLRNKHQQTVLGAFLSPSNDQYLHCKFPNGDFIPDTRRAAYCAAMLFGHPLARLGAWEVQVSDGSWPDFPDVCSALEAALRQRYASSAVVSRIRVGYCCGEDHFRRCGLHHGVTATVPVCVVSRSGQLPSVSVEKNPPGLLGRVVVVQGIDEHQDSSSSRAREAFATLQELMPPEVLREFVAGETAAAVSFPTGRGSTAPNQPPKQGPSPSGAE